MKKINIEGLKRILKRGKMVLIPLALSSAIICTGCSTTSEDSLIKKGREHGVEMSMVDNSLFTYDELLYRMDKFDTISDYGKPFHIEKNCTPKEFGKIVGEENITWDDIKETIKEKQFDNEMEEILLNGVDNLKQKLPNVNLSVLSYNIKNLTIIDSYDESIMEEEDNFYGETIEIQGKFDFSEDIMYLNPSIKNNKKVYRNTLIHELLGHGLSLGYTELEGGVSCVLHNFYSNTDKSNKDLDYLMMNVYEVGGTVEEAVAAMITVLATGERMHEVNREQDGPYDMYILELQILLSSTNTSLTELINNGFESFVDKMHKMGCPAPIDYLYEMEQRKNTYLCGWMCDEDFMLQDLLFKYLMEMSLNNKQISSTEEMKQYAHSCIDSVNTYINPDIYDNEHYVSWTNDSVCEMVYIESLKEDIDGVFSENQFILK